MRIQSDGNVGIGTTAATSTLTVNGSLSATTLYGDGSNLTGVGSSSFTGGTVSGSTTFTNGLSANTFSATTLYGDGSNLTGINAYQYPTYKTGNTITFESQYFYNSRSLPGTGNITENLTGAQLGVVQKIYHNDSVLPSFPSGWILIGSGTYVISSLNIIMCEWIGETSTEYWILQDQ